MLSMYLSVIQTPEEEKKFTILYETYAEFMYHIAYGVLQHHQDAEDAVHQVFLKIAENIDLVDGSVCTRTKNFMATVTEHKSIDIYRKKMRHPEEEYVDANFGITVNYDKADRMLECLDGLPCIQREVLLLKHYHGYSSKEVAKILGMAESNVITIDYRAKKKLREQQKGRPEYVYR